jgi:hypothetical protein
VFAPAPTGNVAGNRVHEQAYTEERVSSLRWEIALLREWLTDARSERDRLAENIADTNKAVDFRTGETAREAPLTYPVVATLAPPDCSQRLVTPGLNWDLG